MINISNYYFIITSLIFILLGIFIKNKIFSIAIILSGIFSIIYWIKPSINYSKTKILDLIFSTITIIIYLYYTIWTITKYCLLFFTTLFFMLSWLIFIFKSKLLKRSYMCHFIAHILCIINLIYYIYYNNN